MQNNRIAGFGPPKVLSDALAGKLNGSAFERRLNVYLFYLLCCLLKRGGQTDGETG
jgi:hypothetical protein